MLCVLLYIRQRNRKKNLKGKGRKNLFRYSTLSFRILSFPDDENIPHCRNKAYKKSDIFIKFRDDFKKNAASDNSFPQRIARYGIFIPISICSVPSQILFANP